MKARRKPPSEHIVDVLLESGPLSTRALSDILRSSRQRLEYHLKQLTKTGLLRKRGHRWHLDYAGLHTKRPSFTVSGKQAVEDYMAFLLNYTGCTRTFFVEPYAGDGGYSFDVFFDRLLLKKGLVHEGVGDERVLSILKTYSTRDLKQLHERLFVFSAIPQSFLKGDLCAMSFGDFVIEIDQKKERLMVTKDPTYARIVELAVSLAKEYGKRIDINAFATALVTERISSH